MQLTRRRIIAAAMDLIERDGVEAVTMHRLATELGCGLVPLYCYVPSRSALLDGVANALISGFHIPSPAAGSWQKQLRAEAMAFREMARAHPRCAMVLVSRPPASAGVLRPAERALATLRGAGFSGQDSVGIIRAVVAYIIGSLLAEVGVAPGLTDSGDELHRPRLRPSEFPQLAALATEPEVSTPDADFEFGLDLLVRSVVAIQPKRAVAS